MEELLVTFIDPIGSINVSDIRIRVDPQKTLQEVLNLITSPAQALELTLCRDCIPASPPLRPSHTVFESNLCGRLYLRRTCHSGANSEATCHLPVVLPMHIPSLDIK